MPAIKIHPLMGVCAMRARMGGAWRAWALLRHLDKEGAGVVGAEAGAAWACDLGVPRRRWRRWVAEGLENGFLQKIVRQRDGGQEVVYRLVSAARASLIVGCDGVGARPVEIAADLLIRHDCRAPLWAAYLATLRHAPISRACMRTQTGVPETTQRRYEAEMGIQATANYAVTDHPESRLDGFKEFIVPHAFVYNDRGRKVCAFRLPDTRTVNVAGIQPLNRGSARKVNKRIKALCVNMDAERAQIRMYHQNHKSLNSALNRMRRCDIQEKAYTRHEVLFERRATPARNGSILWSLIPVMVG